jgi:hypothetical protein
MRIRATASRLLVVVAVCAMSMCIVGVPRAYASTYNQNLILSDRNMRAVNSMSQAGIQAFLTTQTGVLKSLVTTSSAGETMTASAIISQACQNFGISPKVILTMLQKEQSLLTRTTLTSSTLTRALGAGCPSSTVNYYPGFGNQVWYAAWLLSNYGEVQAFPTSSVALWSSGMTYSGGTGVIVTPANLATYKLYVYNPSISGNSNFWTIYATYFGDPLAGALATLTYTAGANGTITGTSPQTVASGASGTAVTAVAASGYHFTGWSDGVTTATRTDAGVSGNISVTANFAISTCALSPSAGAGGTISPATAQTVNCGDSMTFTIAPATGYHIAGVLVDGVSNAGAIASGSYTFTDVQVAHTIAATFAANALTKLPTKLTITSNKTTVARGQTITFSGTIAPNTGNGSLVRVYIRNSASSTWMLSSVRSTYSSGHWSYAYKIPGSHARGTYYAQARYSESSRYLASVSASRAFVIK